MGNSVAMGDTVFAENNKNTFSFLLEKNLRLINSNIDLINTAYYGFNSWQEYVEAVRYFNNYHDYDDLPKPKLILSIGGIQDFWQFTKYLINSSQEIERKYTQANGFMLNKKTFNFASQLEIVERGNPLQNLGLFIKSNISFYKNISNINYLYALKRGNLLNKQEKEFFYDKDIVSIESILYNLNLNKEEYEEIIETAAQSTVRNINALSNLIDKNSFVYIYMPSRFSSLKEKQKYKLEEFNIEGFQLTNIQLSFLEKDYKKTLIKLLKINKIKYLDYSDMGEYYSWFNDNSHLSIEGSKKMSEKISKDLINKLSITN